MRGESSEYDPPKSNKSLYRRSMSLYSLKSPEKPVKKVKPMSKAKRKTLVKVKKL